MARTLRRHAIVKFLCLAYGDSADWEKLDEDEQREMLAHDQVLLDRGDYVAPLQPGVTTVTNWDGTPQVSSVPHAVSRLPLVGFSLIEATDVSEVVHLVAGTPCARAQGYIEVRPLLEK